MFKLKRLATTVLLTLSTSLVAFSGAAHSASLKLTAGDQWPPFNDSSMPGGGYATEIVEEVLKKAGSDFDIKVLPWTRAYNQTAAGKYHGTFSWYDSPERREQMLYSDALFSVSTNVFMKAGQAGGRSALKDLKGMSVCVPKGYTLQADVQAMADAGDITLTSTKTLLHCLKQVKAGRSDAVVGAKPVLLHMAKQDGIAASEFDILPEAVSEAPLYMLFSKKWGESKSFVKTFNVALKSLHDSGRIAEIMR